MKSIILICAAVIITSGAFAKTNTTTNLTTSNSQNQNVVVTTGLSSPSFHFSGNNSHSKYHRHFLKQLLSNPFHSGKLNRSGR